MLKLNLSVAQKLHRHRPVPKWYTIFEWGALREFPNLKASRTRTSQENKSEMRLAVILIGVLAVITSAASAETFKVGEITRTYTAIIPKTTPAPLVLVLHGNTQQGDD